MHLVAISSSEAELLRQIWRVRDPLGRFHLHAVNEHSAGQLLPALQALEFAGALVLDPEAQVDITGVVQRSSLEAQEAGAVDTVTVTAAGIIGEYNFGRALGQLLREAGWDAAGARATILGAGPQVRAAARELSSLGAAEIAILSASRPEAEQSAPRLAASTRLATRPIGDPLAVRHLQDSDLIVRLDARMPVPFEALGPHLTLVDLGSEDLSKLRSQALNVGALSFNRRDFNGHFMALALSQMLGGTVDAEPFLSLFHQSVH